MGIWERLWPELVKGLPAAFVALVIGGIAAYVAWRQLHVARAKLNLDLFERREGIYDDVRFFLSASGRNADEVDKTREKFFSQIPKAYFLFGSEIGDFMTLAQANARELHQAELVLRSTPAASLLWEEARATDVRLERFFERELKNLRGRFGPYMDFTEWRRHESTYWTSIKRLFNTTVRITIVR